MGYLRRGRFSRIFRKPIEMITRFTNCISGDIASLREHATWLDNAILYYIQRDIDRDKKIAVLEAELREWKGRANRYYAEWQKAEEAWKSCLEAYGSEDMDADE